MKKYKTAKEVVHELENEGKLNRTEGEKLEQVYGLAKYGNTQIKDQEVEAVKEILK